MQLVKLEPYTIERCHEFYKGYIADPAMTYDSYVYDKTKINQYYLDKVMQSDRCFFAICYGHKTVGEIQLKRIDSNKKCGTLSIHLINDNYKNKGLGTEAIKLLLNYSFNTLGLINIYADAVHRNTRSIHVLKKIGFTYLYQDEILIYFKYDYNFKIDE